ncbi:hypothetical protein DM02DRAFT_508818, partial [Periconia macrospinosa]
IITSRTELEIEDKLALAWDIDLGKTNQSALDVAAYIEGTVADYGRLNNFGDESTREIIQQLTKKAEGMFLWATLAWALFTDGVGMWTKTLVQRKIDGLRQLPTGIETLYHRVLSLVDKRIAGELSAALKWIVAAERELTLDEIAVALALRARPRRESHLDIPFNLGMFFRKACPHLVKMDDSGVIRLVHLSLKTYLTETKEVDSGAGWLPNPFHFDLRATRYDVGLDCLCYIGIEDYSRETLAEAKKRRFFSYSHENWIIHLDSLQGTHDELASYFFRLLDFETKKLRWYDTSKMIFQLWDRGLKQLFEPAARFGMNLNVCDDNGDHIIHHICDLTALDELDDMEQDIHWLVMLGVDLNGRTSLGQTLLHMLISLW